MTGEYNVKIKPYPKNMTWRNTKMLSCEVTINIDDKPIKYIGLIAKEF